MEKGQSRFICPLVPCGSSLAWEGIPRDHQAVIQFLVVCFVDLVIHSEQKCHCHSSTLCQENVAEKAAHFMEARKQEKQRQQTMTHSPL